MKRILFHLFLLAGLLSISLSPFQLASALPHSAPPPPGTQADEKDRVEQAIQEAITTNANYVLAYLLYRTEIDGLELSTDQNWAVAWINPIDPETNQVIPAEPGLALAQRVAEDWEVTLQSDSEWAGMIQQVPSDLLSAEDKTAWLEMYAASEAQAAAGPFGGYLLPWAAGKRILLTRSILHYNPPDPDKDMHHAFDFAARWDSTNTSPMFEVFAAKAGTVKYAVWSHPNGNETNTNYLVLEDTSTFPTTYQVYLHLAQDSIPAQLRVKGAYVLQGQYIGLADDTGLSTGNHLHFQVHTNPNSYWGKAVDIIFDDVAINGGRPRTPGEAKNFPQYGNQGQTEYISGNKIQGGDYTPPVGDILLPLHGITVSTGTLHLEGRAVDEQTGLDTAQFIANYSGAWHPIGEPFTNASFSLDWDLCASGVPDGPVSLALQLKDRASNQTITYPGLRHFTKNYTCPPPPPSCVPKTDEVALFADPDFGGACVVFKSGPYTASLGALGNDNAESIRVGSGVQATLFMDSNQRGRGETFVADNSNLADNWIGSNTVSSLWVQSRGAQPLVPNLVWPADNETFTSTNPAGPSLSLVWDNAGGALEYQVERNESLLAWQSDPVLHLGSLLPGSYSWRVRARANNSLSGWSAKRTLKVQTASSSGPVAPVTAPYIDAMEGDSPIWSPTGSWGKTTPTNHTPDGSVSWRYAATNSDDYDTGSPNTGDLTSPPIQIPTDQTYYLRFWSSYETESQDIHWDQRWVQISVDGGPFTNTLQLANDPPGYWVQSPAISLSDYDGHTIQALFHLETLDKALNQFKGWYIDDFSITSTPPPTCSSNEENNTPEKAKPVSYGDVISAEICPGGEIDYYMVNGMAGDQVGVAVDAQAIGSKLDPSLFLLDSDGTSVLAQNDDQIETKRTDSSLTLRLPRTGVYYIKVKAWDHPTAGGDDYPYRLRLVHESEDPVAGFVDLMDGSLLPSTPISLTVSANDSLSGISHVEFLWHPADWMVGDWEVLGEDWDGSDGWNYSLDLTELKGISGFAVYARTYDWAGNWIGTGAWNLRTPTSLLYLPVLQK